MDLMRSSCWLELMLRDAVLVELRLELVTDPDVWAGPLPPGEQLALCHVLHIPQRTHFSNSGIGYVRHVPLLHALIKRTYDGLI